MYALFDAFLDIVLLRKGPQDLPASGALFKLTAIAYALSGLLVVMVGREVSVLVPAALLVGLDMALIMGLVYTVLSTLKQTVRFMQTLSALFGVSILLHAIALPLAIWLVSAATGSGDPSLPWVLSQLLFIWSIVVVGHILRHAFSVSRFVGVLYALAYVVISLALAEWLLPRTSLALNLS